MIVENVNLNTMSVCSYHREYYSERNQVRCCDPFLSHANIAGMTRKKEKNGPKKAMIEIIMLQQYTNLLRPIIRFQKTNFLVKHVHTSAMECEST